MRRASVILLTTSALSQQLKIFRLIRQAQHVQVLQSARSRLRCRLEEVFQLLFRLTKRTKSLWLLRTLT